ncbi:MAG: glycoside hydrolase family 127 protein, partial [Anaerolineae bacterium]|nr:glycoside hydrolase family 127 protein [Anaerolineae bacterium]
LHLRIPEYAEGASVELNGAALEIDAVAGTFAVIEREWQPGDTVRLSLPLKVVAQANEDLVALKRGPLVYAYFQDAQADPMVFHHRRGMYPEDVVLEVDPQSPAVVEVEPPDGMLGPALRVAGQVRAKAPIFAQAAGNKQLQPAEPLTVTLLPFVNQGSIRGEYGVFMAYKGD